MVWYITCHVMLCYVTVQLVQKGQFNGKSRPKVADIVEVMVKLQRDGFIIIILFALFSPTQGGKGGREERRGKTRGKVRR